MVLKECIEQIVSGNRSIIGFMIESNLEDGNQAIPDDLSKLKYGVSVTDKCVNWQTTDTMIRNAYQALKARRV